MPRMPGPADEKHACRHQCDTRPADRGDPLAKHQMTQQRAHDEAGRDHRQDVAEITGIAHGQLDREDEAGGGLGQDTRLAPKRGGAVALPLAKRGKGLAQVVLPQLALPVGESMYVNDRLVKQDVRK